MVLKELIGKEVIWKSNKCNVLNVGIAKDGANILQLEAEPTETTNATPWVDIDEIRIDVYFTERPRLYGILVDAHDGWAKVEWKDADGVVVPFRVDPKTKQLVLTKENCPIMSMKIFDMELNKISLY